MTAYGKGELLGHQRPRIQHLPDWGPNLVHASRAGGIPPELGSLGREIVDLAAVAGLILDPWQAWIMEQAHVIRPDHRFWNPYTDRYECKWAAFEVGVMVSRQNGKGSILEARELAGLFLFGERLIIHSAHQADTSFEAFERIVHLIEDTPVLDQEVFKISRSHGAEGIELKSGQRLKFRTRTKGGGRGFTGDTLILDEAMYLGSAQISALMPTLSARPNAQVWVTGSAGDKESTHFGRVRERALSTDDPDPRLFYAEWSIDGCNDYCVRPDPDGTFNCEEHDDPGTVESFAKSNPGLGIRISVEHVEAERRSMDDASFKQERLGVGDWPIEGNSWSVISRESWLSRADHTSEIQGRLAIAVDTSPDCAFSCVAAAGYNAAKDIHVELTATDGEYHHRPGTSWVVDVVKAIWKAQKPYCVVIDKAGQAGMFVTELEDAGIKVLTPNSREFAQSCGEFKTAVVPKKGEEAYLVHCDQKPLNVAVAGADVRTLTDMWAWSKRESSVDISPLIAATLAMWGLKEEASKRSSIPMMAFGR